MKRALLMPLGILALLVCAAGLIFKPLAMLGAYLTVWWFWMGIALGGLSNVWLHNLTGGQWGESIRGPLLRISHSIPLAALLFLPVLLGMYYLFPWAADSGNSLRWAGELSAPAFKRVWLTPEFFVARSLVYLAVWCALSFYTQRQSLARAKGFSAAALILYGLTAGLAAADWVMSLMPLWYSSVFGWLVGIGQMLGGMALGTACAARGRETPALVFRDLGNLLLMYVLLWAYLAFSQFLIIWAENLPHEIVWYVARRELPWSAVAWLLALFFFMAPLLILLSRSFKQTPRALGLLAAVLLFTQFVNTCWLILPSLSVPAIHWLWALPAAAGLLAALVNVWWRREDAGPFKVKELHHA